VSAKAVWDGACFHVASGKLSTAHDVVEALATAWGAAANLVFDATRTTTPQPGTVSIAKIAALGFRPSLQLAEGCKAFVEAHRRPAESAKTRQ